MPADEWSGRPGHGRTAVRPRPLRDDLQALDAYEAARELGPRIPEDLSVVGFDDLPLARWIGPPLTTVRQPLIEMAETAARPVLDLARGERPATTRVDLATRPVVRSSPAADPFRRAPLTRAGPHSYSIAARTGAT